MDLSKYAVYFLLMAVLVVSGTPAHAASDPDAIVGTWRTADNDANIEIYKCGNAYCGKIASMRDPNYSASSKDGMAGLLRIDRRNPDPALRNRPLLDLTFITGFRYVGRNSWEGGKIYSPDDGNIYRANISLKDNRRLELRGYIGIPLLGQTETWTRVAPDDHNWGAPKTK